MPVNSMVNITLWINGQGNKSMIEVNSIMNFNPFEGFSVPINFSVTSIDCIGQLNNRISEPLTFAVHSNVPAAIPQMSVTSDPDHYALINDTIVLTCSVNTDDFVYQPEWHNVKNGTQQRSITEVLVGDSNITTVLSIYNVEKVDENCYLCEIRTPCNKVTEEICIAVYDSKPLPSFNLSTHVDKPMLMKVGEKLILVAYINIVPLDSINDIDFFWYKDGRRLEEFEEHFNITLNLPKKATLRISSLNFSDTGTYMFSGNTTDESKNISIVVLVEGEPQIIISGKTSQKFYMAGTRNVFLCDVKGKPLPNITWNWKACSSYDLCDINSTVVQSALTLPNLDRVMLGDISEFQRISRLEVRAHQTGFYSCVAENEYGNNEETFLFLVTDAENGFQVKMSVMKPVELDNVTIECKASLYEYEDIRWELFPLSSKNSSIFTLDGNYSDMDVISSATSYSHQLTITFHPIYNDNSGTYVCYAEPSNNTFSTANRSVSFVVRDIWKPVIVSTNLNGSKIMIKPNQEQEFYCFARGIPDPVVTWYRNNQLLNGTDTTALHFKSNNQMLVINRVIKTDDGIYHCNATNRGGFAVRNLTLQVITGKTEETSGFQISTKHVIITACVLTAVLVTCMLYIFGSKIYKRKKRRRRLPFMNSAKFSQGHLELLNSDLPFEEQAELLPYDHCWEFPKDRLKLGITLGQGVFGRVVKAEAIGLIPAEPSSTVAVKLLKEQADINQQRALMTELKILSHLGHHVNIVNLLGAVTKNLHKGELMVLVEYCHHGNLRHYLLHNRENFINQINKATGEIDIDCNELPFLPSTSEDDEGNAVFNSIAVGVKPQSQRDRAASTSELLHYRTNSSNSDPPSRRSSIFTLPDTHPIDNKKENDNKDNITTCDLLSYSFQCARGMEYLASRKLLHRDLAARNVLLAEGNIIKICDFGLAKDLYEYGSYVKKGDGPLPIKWMAIESIRDKIFTTKSDVWSFGILLWEIYTLGRNPYPGIDLNEQFFKKLNDGYRMEKPEYSPSSVYNIMTSCWEAEPKSRPDFKILVNLLGTVLEESVRQHYVDFNNEHSEIANDDETDNCTCEMHEYVNVDRKHSPSVSSNEGSQRRIISNNYDKAQKKQNNSPSASLREGSLRKNTLRHYDSIQSLGRHSPSMSSNDGSQRIALRHYDSIQTVKRTPDGISLQVPTEVVPVISLESDKPNQLSPTNSQYMDIQNEQLLQEHSSNSHESSEHSSYYELSLENLSDSCANSSSVIS